LPNKTSPARFPSEATASIETKKKAGMMKMKKAVKRVGGPAKKKAPEGRFCDAMACEVARKTTKRMRERSGARGG